MEYGYNNVTIIMRFSVGVFDQCARLNAIGNGVIVVISFFTSKVGVTLELVFGIFV